jgi:hypothetical protein
LTLEFPYPNASTGMIVSAKRGIEPAVPISNLYFPEIIEFGM